MFALLMRSPVSPDLSVWVMLATVAALSALPALSWVASHPSRAVRRIAVGVVVAAMLAVSVPALAVVVTWPPGWEHCDPWVYILLGICW